MSILRLCRMTFLGSEAMMLDLTRYMLETYNCLEE